MNEIAQASSWIYSTLAADTTLSGLVTGIFRDFAPEESTYPLVTFHLQAASDVNFTGAYRAMTQPLFLVRVVGKAASYATLQAAADRIDALLTVRTAATITFNAESATLLGSLRERPFATAYLVNGVRFDELGGLYRLSLGA